jgi:hypothetical protein
MDLEETIMNKINDCARFSQAIVPYKGMITNENKTGIMNGLKKMFWYVEIDATKSKNTNALVLKSANIFKIVGRLLSLGFLFKDIYSRKACQEVIKNFTPISETNPQVQAESKRVQDAKNSQLGSNLSSPPPVVISQGPAKGQNIPNITEPKKQEDLGDKNNNTGPISSNVSVSLVPVIDKPENQELKHKEEEKKGSSALASNQIAAVSTEASAVAVPKLTVANAGNMYSNQAYFRILSAKDDDFDEFKVRLNLLKENYYGNKVH